VGGSDCERIGQGLFAQPVNTLSSLAYVLAGVLLLWRALADRAHPRTARLAYAVTVIGVGVGSVSFHGPMPGWGRLAHDLSIAAVLAFVIGYGITLARGYEVDRALAIFAVLVGMSAVVLAWWPDSSNALDAVLVAGAVAGEVVASRSPSGRGTTDARVWFVGAIVLTIGAVLNALGRTDGPWCNADSRMQLHAFWHVLTAFVLWLYGVTAVGPREQARHKIRA